MLDEAQKYELGLQQLACKILHWSLSFFYFFLLHLEAGAGAKCSLFFTLLLQYITYLQPLQYNIKFI